MMTYTQKVDGLACTPIRSLGGTGDPNSLRNDIELRLIVEKYKN